MMQGALSGKTGFTNRAGYCYVGALQRDGKTLVVALLACGWPSHKTYKWSDTRTLMEYGLANYDFRSLDEVAMPKQTLEPIPIHGAKGNGINEIVLANVKLLEAENAGNIKNEGNSSNTDKILLRDDEKITVILHKVKELSAPVKAGDKVGHVSYRVGNDELKRLDLVITESREKIDFNWCFRQAFMRWTL